MGRGSRKKSPVRTASPQISSMAPTDFWKELLEERAGDGVDTSTRFVSCLKLSCLYRNARGPFTYAEATAPSDE